MSPTSNGTSSPIKNMVKSKVASSKSTRTHANLSIKEKLSSICLSCPRSAHVLILFVISCKFLFPIPLFGIFYVSHVFGVEIEWPEQLCFMDYVLHNALCGWNSFPHAFSFESIGQYNLCSYKFNGPFLYFLKSGYESCTRCILSNIYSSTQAFNI